MEDLVTQVSQNGGENVGSFLNGHGESASGGDTSNYSGDDMDRSDLLIHLNIQESHYYLSRDQLMSLPESLLLCLFPSGVFLNREGQVITNLTPNDEVYIGDFAPSCFEYMMDVYLRAYDDLGSSNANRRIGSAVSEEELLHQKPVIIVLREDLDYYCVPQLKFAFGDNNKHTPTISDGELLHYFMSEVKMAAGNYLSQNRSIFDGLYSSNTLARQSPDAEGALGAAEQHLMDMLCSSGLSKSSDWGNRTQEHGKTVISSLKLCRIANSTTKHSSTSAATPINTKLLLFWRKPARKCWWGEESVDLTVSAFASLHRSPAASKLDTLQLAVPTDADTPVQLTVPVKLHIRRVWTLELSLVGVQ